WQQFADVDPPEGRGILDADQRGARRIHFEDRAASVDQEHRVRGDLEQLAEPGLRPSDELLRPLPLRDVPRDRRASDQAARAVPESSDRPSGSRTVSKGSSFSPFRRRAMIRSNSFRRSSGTSISTCWPTASIALYPYMRSAPVFHVRISPVRDFAKIASSELWTIAASRACASRAPTN